MKHYRWNDMPEIVHNAWIKYWKTYEPDYEIDKHITEANRYMGHSIKVWSEQIIKLGYTIGLTFEEIEELKNYFTPFFFGIEET